MYIRDNKELKIKTTNKQTNKEKQKDNPKWNRMELRGIKNHMIAGKVYWKNLYVIVKINLYMYMLFLGQQK